MTKHIQACKDAMVRERREARTFRSSGSIRAESIRQTYLRPRRLIRRGVFGENLLAITWWSDMELHVLLLRLNGHITGEMYLVIPMFTSRNERSRIRRVRRH